MSDKRKQRPKRQPKLRETKPEPESLVEQIGTEQDRLAFVAVMQDRREGRESTQSKLRGAARYEKTRNLQTSLTFMQKVERKWLNRWGGIANKQIEDACERYGVPVKGPVWSVPELVHWIFRFLGKNGRLIFRAQVNGETPDDGETSVWLEELRKENALIQRIRRRELERELISVHVVKRTMELAGAALRLAAQRLQRECPPHAWEVFDEGLSNVEQILERFFADIESEEDDSEGTARGDADLLPGGATAEVGGGNGRGGGGE